ncbi:MAG: hypothetical protein [Caudoviricetes sp.]|nr:MAG: hypothetical protein [Caudoviricetes sp.]
MKTTTQLKKIINNEDEKILSDKLNNYCTDHLETLRQLILRISYLDDNYTPYQLYNNGYDFWDFYLDSPFETIQSIGTHYNIKDKYVYKNVRGLFNSRNTLKGFYSESDIQELTESIIYQLKNHINDNKKDLNILLGNLDFNDHMLDLLVEVLK